MPIKKSFLEQKWYYRVAKVFLLILPLLVALIFYLKDSIFFLGLLEVNIVYVVLGLVAYYLILKLIWRLFLYIAFGGLENDTKKKGSEATQPVRLANPASQQAAPIIILVIVFAIAALALSGYIKLPNLTSHTYGAACTSSAGKTGLYGTNGNCLTCSGGGVAVTNPLGGNCSDGIAGVYCCSTADGDNGVDECISTGCGSMWYCSGSYYIDGQEIRVPGLCFPTHPRNIYSGWTGTCRQCP